eukprot:scaffold8577_cov110-Isochrysis_galbana.AAC.1
MPGRGGFCGGQSGQLRHCSVLGASSGATTTSALWTISGRSAAAATHRSSPAAPLQPSRLPGELVGVVEEPAQCGALSLAPHPGRRRLAVGPFGKLHLRRGGHRRGRGIQLQRGEDEARVAGQGWRVGAKEGWARDVERRGRGDHGEARGCGPGGDGWAGAPTCERAHMAHAHAVKSLCPNATPAPLASSTTRRAAAGSALRSMTNAAYVDSSACTPSLAMRSSTSASRPGRGSVRCASAWYNNRTEKSAAVRGATLSSKNRTSSSVPCSLLQHRSATRHARTGTETPPTAASAIASLASRQPPSHSHAAFTNLSRPHGEGQPPSARICAHRPDMRAKSAPCRLHPQNSRA